MSLWNSARMMMKNVLIDLDFIRNDSSKTDGLFDFDFDVVA